MLFKFEKKKENWMAAGKCLTGARVYNSTMSVRDRKEGIQREFSLSLSLSAWIIESNPISCATSCPRYGRVGTSNICRVNSKLSHRSWCYCILASTHGIALRKIIHRWCTRTRIFKLSLTEKQNSHAAYQA